jgi:AraC-like DNA-binding protein
MYFIIYFRLCHGNDLVADLKALVQQKIMHIAGCVENGRYQNLIPSIEDTIEMVIQLSQFTDVENTLNLMEEAFPYLNGIITNLGDDGSSIAACSGPELEYHVRGRPTFKIPLETLEFFLDNGFKVAEIARLTGVSKRTIERRLSENALSVRQSYSQMTDEELEGEVNTIVTDYPHVGYRTVSAFLRGKGHRVQEKRVRHAMRNVDSCGVLFRRLFLSTSRIQRRSYSVTAPQALWHIDGNHKLIR